MLQTKLCLSEIHPYVRYVQRIIIQRETYPAFSNVRPYDCRLFYVQEGQGVLRIGSDIYGLEQGQVILWNSGVDYHLRSDERNPLILLGVNFDYTQHFAALTTPIPPDPVDWFDPGRDWECVEFTDFPHLNLPVQLNNMLHVQEALQSMLQEYKAQKLFCSIQLSSMMTDILVTVCRSLSFSVSDRNASAAKIDRVIRYIHGHYAEEIDNNSLGLLFGYHPNYLSHLIKLYTGKSMHQYIISYRIARAIDLLLATEMNVEEIASCTGFKDLPHFSKLFKEKTGCTPSALRANGIHDTGSALLPME